MKSLIVYYSYHHNNTRKIAEAMANAIAAVVKTVSDTNENELEKYSFIGFGSGIDSGKHYMELLNFSLKLPPVAGKPCFIFSTSAIQGEEKVAKDHAALRKILQSKGYTIIGEFSCKGYNTNSFLKFIGGMNKTRPNEEDVLNARRFAMGLKGSEKLNHVK